jgi:hypothetical protein
MFAVNSWLVILNFNIWKWTTESFNNKKIELRKNEQKLNKEDHMENSITLAKRERPLFINLGRELLYGFW